MRRLAPVFALLVLACSAASAGVVIEMEVKGPGSGAAAAVDTLYAQDGMLRMDPRGSQDDQNTSMIFRDDTMWIVDHDKKRCQTMGKDDIAALSEQLGGAMKELEAQMANLPPEQRAMMEKMMKGRMPAGMGQPALPRRLEKGATETVGDYACTLNTLYVGDEKAWEVCAAKEGAVSGADEAMRAFRALSAFMEDLRDSLQKLPMAKMMDTPFAEMEKIDGIPVRVRIYSGGTVQSESTIKSVTRRDIEPDMFVAPKGYKVTDLASEMKNSR